MVLSITWSLVTKYLIDTSRWLITWWRQALVYFILAVHSIVCRGTVTAIGFFGVYARATIHAWAGNTGVNLYKEISYLSAKDSHRYGISACISRSSSVHTFANFAAPTCDTKIGLLGTNVLVEIEQPGTGLRIGKKEEKVGEWREPRSSLVASTQATARLGFCLFPPLWSRSFFCYGGRGGGTLVLKGLRHDICLLFNCPPTPSLSHHFALREK